MSAASERIQRELSGYVASRGRKPKLDGKRLADFKRAYWAWHDNSPQQLQRRFGISAATYGHYVKLIRGEGRL